MNVVAEVLFLVEKVIVIQKRAQLHRPKIKHKIQQWSRVRKQAGLVA
tara:strand:- start:196 stop:336 length:141 start_codon:yes stop_codon:yes gene_type:complete